MYPCPYADRQSGCPYAGSELSYSDYPSGYFRNPTSLLAGGGTKIMEIELNLPLNFGGSFSFLSVDIMTQFHFQEVTRLAKDTFHHQKAEKEGEELRKLMTDIFEEKMNKHKIK